MEILRLLTLGCHVYFLFAPAYVLIDSNSTHSFVSNKFASKLPKSIESLDCIILRSIPSGGPRTCTSIYKSSVMLAEDTTLLVLSHTIRTLGSKYARQIREFAPNWGLIHELH